MNCFEKKKKYIASDMDARFRFAFINSVYYNDLDYFLAALKRNIRIISAVSENYIMPAYAKWDLVFFLCEYIRNQKYTNQRWIKQCYFKR